MKDGDIVKFPAPLLPIDINLIAKGGRYVVRGESVWLEYGGNLQEPTARLERGDIYEFGDFKVAGEIDYKKIDKETIADLLTRK